MTAALWLRCLPPVLCSAPEVPKPFSAPATERRALGPTPANAVVRLCQYPPRSWLAVSRPLVAALVSCFTHQASLLSSWKGRDATVGMQAALPLDWSCRKNALCTMMYRYRQTPQPPFPRNTIYTANPLSSGNFSANRQKQKYRPNSTPVRIWIYQPRAPASPANMALCPDSSCHAPSSIRDGEVDPFLAATLEPLEAWWVHVIYILVHPSHIYRQIP